MTRKTKLEIINETAEFYGSDVTRRSKSNGQCVYLAVDTGNRCAFSRCCTEDGVKELSFNYEGRPANWLSDYFINSVLKEEYKGHNRDFWVAIQMFHDNDGYFDKNGISNAGQNYIEHLKEKYSSDSAN